MKPERNYKTDSQYKEEISVKESREQPKNGALK